MAHNYRTAHPRCASGAPAPGMGLYRAGRKPSETIPSSEPRCLRFKLIPPTAVRESSGSGPNLDGGSRYKGHLGIGGIKMVDPFLKFVKGQIPFRH